MAEKINKDAIYRAAKPKEKDYFINDGGGQYVFPSSRGNGRPMSDNTIHTALKSLGYDSDVMTAHGIRTTASTLIKEQGCSPDAIERQLAHAPRDQVRAAYNRRNTWTKGGG